MRLTESAKKMWNVLSGPAKLKLLNFVWCRSCLDVKGMHPETAQVKAGQLVIKGNCMECGEALQMSLEWRRESHVVLAAHPKIPKNSGR